MTITTEGAGLIAQLIPIGLLVLGVEARAGYRRSATTPKLVSAIAAGVVFLIGAFSLWAMFISVHAVNVQEDLEAPSSWLVLLSSFALYAIAGAVAILLAFDVFLPDDENQTGSATPVLHFGGITYDVAQADVSNTQLKLLEAAGGATQLSFEVTDSEGRAVSLIWTPGVALGGSDL